MKERGMRGTYTKWEERKGEGGSVKCEGNRKRGFGGINVIVLIFFSRLF